MYLFSIIVPVYNVEQYLDECIKSLICQTYNHIEIILVDDGSTDSSGVMCDIYKEKDSRICVIHKENKGLSSARNAALEIAHGDYILYVDSDDYIARNFLDIIAKQLCIKEYDMLVAQTVNFRDGETPSEIIYKKPQNQCFTSEEALEAVYYQHPFDTNGCAKVMRKEIAKSHPFVEGILYEDFKNIYGFISECKEILYMSEPKYFYRQRVNSIMNSSFDYRKLVLIDIAKENLDFVEKSYPNVTNAAIRRYVYSNFHILGRTIQIDEMIEKSKELRENILLYKGKILINTKVCLKEKISVCILCLGLKPYKIFWNLYCVIKRKRIG